MYMYVKVRRTLTDLSYEIHETRESGRRTEMRETRELNETRETGSDEGNRR